MLLLSDLSQPSSKRVNLELANATVDLQRQAVPQGPPIFLSQASSLSVDLRYNLKLGEDSNREEIENDS